jgi:histidinol-phosphatase
VTTPADAEPASDLGLALRMADAADAITLARFGAGDLVVDTKPDLTPVSDADRAVEAALRAMLGDERPEDTILGEEEGGSVAAHGRGWILDPIDGTKNFVRGVPVWATLIGLVVDGTVTVGMVSAPALARRWWARTGSGAWGTCPGATHPRRLRTSQVGSLADASLSYSDEAGWGAREDAFSALRRSVWRTRAYGDFWSHLLVAEGAVDIAVEPELSAWDIAALVPIITESGGRISGFDGSEALAAGCAVTTNGPLHDIALSALADV